MNEPGLGEVIDDSEGTVKHAVQYNHRLHKDATNDKHRHNNHSGNPSHRNEDHSRKLNVSRRKARFKNEEAKSIYQPTLWWFTSTAFPLFAGTFGPISNLFSVCALVQTWRVIEDSGGRVPDPPWLLALNACSLALALIANFTLLLNFARRIRYHIAQVITITLWYLSCVLLAIPLGLSHNSRVDPPPPGTIYSQSYFYGLISCILYFTVSTLLFISTLGSTVFHAYEPSFNVLTGPQRTLMLQTILFALYLALGAGVFSHIENWGFSDGLYWADYTLLTIGLGSDFPLTTVLGKMLVIPYAAFGIIQIGLVVSSVRGLVLERAKTKVVRRHLGKEREEWKKNIEGRRQLALSRVSTTVSTQNNSPSIRKKSLEQKKERDLMRLPQRLEKHVPEAQVRLQDRGPWHRAEFELMRYIERHGETAERYTALSASFFVILVVWIGGALAFWSCERKSQDWTFPESFYFTYTTLLTIGYGDFFPTSSAGKPFFVVWSLISVPAMTVLISNMGDTVVRWIEDVTVWASRKTILPEKDTDEIIPLKHFRKRKPKTGPQSNSNTKERGNASRTEENDNRYNSIASNPNNPSGSDTQFRAAHADNEGSQEHESAASALQSDIEQLGEDAEKFEEDEGREGSLAARIAKEISILAMDLGEKSPKKYTWEEWSKWLDMLGEKEDEHDRPVSPSESPTQGTSPAAPIFVATHLQSQSRDGATQTDNIPARSEAPYESPLPSAERSAAMTADDWHWTWLSDHGPLFSHLSETEWIIEKLCFRLEEVLMEEIREARRDNDHR